MNQQKALKILIFRVSILVLISIISTAIFVIQRELNKDDSKENILDTQQPTSYVETAPMDFTESI